MQNLRITTIQTSLEWENKAQNLKKIGDKISRLENPVDVIILPEMFNSGFTMNAGAMAEASNGPTADWMLKHASEKDSVIMGSFIVDDQSQYFNRLHVAFPDSRLEVYDKRHLFRMAEEDKTFHYGSSRLVVSWKGWRILPLVCYDLSFPVWSRNTVSNGKFDYDLLVFVANWPKARISAWDALLKARAIENLSYVVGLNRIGADGNHIPYNGHSAIYGPKGEILYSATDRDEVHFQSIDLETLQIYRKKFPANLDADQFEIKG